MPGRRAAEFVIRESLMGIASLASAITSIIGLLAGLLAGGTYYLWLALILAFCGVYFGLTAAVRRRQYAAGIAGLVTGGLVAIISAVAIGVNRGIS